MQEGIGRSGYRALAAVFAGVGALGLAMATVALAPSGFFDWLGLGLAAAAVAALLWLTLSGLSGRVPRPAAAPVPAGAPDERAEDPVPLPTPEPPAAADPGADLGFEYADIEPVQALQPVSHVPEPKPAAGPPPRPLSRPAAATAPPSGRARGPRSASEWPERPPKAGVTRRQLAERDLPRDPGPEIEVEGPAQPRRDPPVVMARTVASAEATGIPDGAGIGKCGNCGVLLLAPKKRPIRLQCPRCERVHTLA